MKTGRPFVIVKHDTVADLRTALKQTKEASVQVRLRVIIKALEGKSRKTLAAELVVSVRAVSDWVKKYNLHGQAGLVTKPSGRPRGNPKWDTAHFEALAKEIDKGGYWSVPRMREWLAKERAVHIPEQTVWYRMSRLNYSYKSARPHPTQGNKEKQASFKKGGSNRSWSR